ncbi:MAG: energy-coupling factor transporter ATPase [Lachnospiraceae bacterium]
MGIIKSKQLMYEYIHRDEEGNVESIDTALKNVNIDIKAGDFIAVLGHNGSGKSTLAKHMNVILEPGEGTMWVDGMDTKEEKNLFPIRQRAGMVFQNPDNQIVAGVVEEDVGFGPENMGIPTEEIWERVEESLKSVNMLKYSQHSPNKLSGGQKQRVAIAGVIAMQPKCIVLDEPTAMLDPVGRRDVLTTIHRLNKEKGVTIILITHNMEEVVDANQVFVMHEGEIVMQGTPREIFTKVEELQSYRLDVPQVTLLAYQLQKAGIKLSNGILTREELVKELCQLF